MTQTQFTPASSLRAASIHPLAVSSRLTLGVKPIDVLGMLTTGAVPSVFLAMLQGGQKESDFLQGLGEARPFLERVAQAAIVSHKIVDANPKGDWEIARGELHLSELFVVFQWAMEDFNKAAAFRPQPGGPVGTVPNGHKPGSTSGEPVIPIADLMGRLRPGQSDLDAGAMG